MPRFGLRAVDMAAPAVLPITTFPHSEPAVSAQTAKSSTCCASIRGAPGRRFSSTPNSVARGEPIVNHLRSFLEAAAVKPPSQSELPQFAIGMHVKDGVSKRLEWKALEAEISRAEAVTAQTKSGLSPRARQRYLLDLRRSVSNAVYELLKDERCEDEDMRSYITDILVWSDPQNARKAIAQEAVTEYVRKLRSKPEEGYRYPVIILATEKAGFQIDQEPVVAASKSDATGLKGDHIQFLEAWREAVNGDAEVLTVVGDSARSIRDSVEAVLEGSDHHWVSTPTLIVMYASYDSAITANMSSIRRLCDANDIKLCLEGPGLAFLGQAARPSDPNECLQHADVLLTNPGSWFGFEECAFTSIHSAHHSSSYEKPDYGQGTNDPSVISSIQREDQRQGKAMAYVTKLWTVLTQIGVPRIREKVDAVTHIAEALIYHLRDCQSLATSYEGVGCVVRLSYELSTSERGFSKIEEAEILSAINRSLYNFVSAEAKELQVFLVVVDNTSVLQFSPLRLLNSRTFWVPGGEQIRKFSDALRQRAEFYRLCRTGALVFMERVALCPDIELLEDDEVTEDVLHWYGAFRVVPGEWQGAWGNSSSGRHVVTALTKRFVSELSDSFASIVMCSPSLKQLLESCSYDGHEKSKAISGDGVGRQRAVNPLHYIFGRGSSANNKSLDPSVIDLPFSFYIHYDDKTFNAPFVSVEPKCTYPVSRAYRHACTAAEVIVAVLQVVLRNYRSKVTVESLDQNFISNSVQREEAPVQSSLGCISEADEEDSSEASRADGISLKESEISATEVNEDDHSGFVSASDTLHAKIPVTRADNHSLHHWEEASSYCDRDKHLNGNANDMGISQLRNVHELPGDRVTNKDVSSIGRPSSSLSATRTQLAQGVQSRIPWLEFVTTEHLSSDADSEGSDGEYTEDEDYSLTEEDHSLSDDGSDYQDTDSSDLESDSESSEDESSENESSKGSTDEEYNGSEESEGESEASSSSSDTESEHENSFLEPVRDLNMEMKPASELLKTDITRSVWLPSWFGSRCLQAPSSKTATEVQDSSRTRRDARRDSSRSTVPSKSKHLPASCSNSDTDESQSVTSDETRQSSSTERSDVSSSGRYGKGCNQRRRSKHRSSRTSKTSRPWGWWKQKPSASSESEDSSTSSDREDRRSNDDGNTSSSDDNGRAFPDAFSIPSSEYSSMGSQDSYSESGSETKESSSSSSRTSSNPSSEEAEERRRSRTRGLSNSGQPRGRYWFPYFRNYGLSGLRNTEESKGLVRAEEKSRSSSRRRRH